MFVGVVARDTPSPEAILTQVVVIAPLTFVTKPHERLSMASFTLHWVEY